VRKSLDIKAFYQRNDVCQMLNDVHKVGWFDGGCLIAAIAIGRYLGAGTLGCVLDMGVPQHFCWLYGGLVFDADGAQSRLSYVVNYAQRESLSSPTLKSIYSNGQIKALACKYGFVLDESMIRKITALLKRE